MIFAMFVSSMLTQVQVDQGPPKSPPSARASVQQLLQQLKIRPDTLRPPKAMASPPATGSAPSAAMATGPADEPPRTAAPRRKHVEELVMEIEQRPEGKRVLDSLRRAGAIRGAPSVKPPMIEITRGPRVQANAEDTDNFDEVLQGTQPIAVLTTASPIVGMTIDYKPTGQGPGFAVVRIGPAIHRWDTKDSWALKVEPICKFAPHSSTQMGQRFPTVYSSSPGVADATARVLTMVNPKPRLDYTDVPNCNTVGATMNAGTATVQPEIVLATTNLAPGTYVINVKAWGKHIVTAAESYDSWGWKDGSFIQGKTLIESPTHGWYDYASVISVLPGSLPSDRFHWSMKVLGPLGLTLYISEIALYKLP